MRTLRQEVWGLAWGCMVLSWDLDQLIHAARDIQESPVAPGFLGKDLRDTLALAPMMDSRDFLEAQRTLGLLLLPLGAGCLPH
jgi:hypothetical protein